MTNYSDVRIFLCTTPTDMHYSFDRLLGRTREIFEQDPLDGHLFLFVNRNRDRLKLLFWDQDGFCIFYKRLERGTFQLLTSPTRKAWSSPMLSWSACWADLIWRPDADESGIVEPREYEVKTFVIRRIFPQRSVFHPAS